MKLATRLKNYMRVDAYTGRVYSSLYAACEQQKEIEQQETLASDVDLLLLGGELVEVQV
jgi:hypothetical protein